VGAARTPFELSQVLLPSWWALNTHNFFLCIVGKPQPFLVIPQSTFDHQQNALIITPTIDHTSSQRKLQGQRPPYIRMMIAGRPCMARLALQMPSPRVLITRSTFGA
jgi:hypothetical protein